MQSVTFRKWLAEHGCRFDLDEHKRGEGQVLVTVHREGRKSRSSGSIGMICLNKRARAKHGDVRLEVKSGPKSHVRV